MIQLAEMPEKSDLPNGIHGHPFLTNWYPQALEGHKVTILCVSGFVHHSISTASNLSDSHITLTWRGRWWCRWRWRRLRGCCHLVHEFSVMSLDCSLHQLLDFILMQVMCFRISLESKSLVHGHYQRDNSLKWYCKSGWQWSVNMGEKVDRYIPGKNFHIK